MSASSKRTQNTRSYKVQVFQPGDQVFVWRIQTRGPAASARTGGFMGPCRALATETRRTEDGQFRPGSCAWVREISIPSERCREPKSATTDYEKTKVRAALGRIGALSWCAQQSCAAVGLFLSQVRDSTVQTMIEIDVQ